MEGGIVPSTRSGRHAEHRPIVASSAQSRQDGAMSEDDVALLTRVAILYYREGLTQQETARRIGVSRQTVGRLLQLAQDKGIVRVEIRSPTAEVESLARRARGAVRPGRGHRRRTRLRQRRRREDRGRAGRRRGARPPAAAGDGARAGLEHDDAAAGGEPGLDRRSRGQDRAARRRGAAAPPSQRGGRHRRPRGPGAGCARRGADGAAVRGHDRDPRRRRRRLADRVRAAPRHPLRHRDVRRRRGLAPVQPLHHRLPQ